MGLFDDLKCEYPLPGTNPEKADIQFQTKDLSCEMRQYTITSDGRLVENSGREDHNSITATLNFYWSNVVASGPGTYTEKARTLTISNTGASS